MHTAPTTSGACGVGRVVTALPNVRLHKDKEAIVGSFSRLPCGLRIGPAYYLQDELGASGGSMTQLRCITISKEPHYQSPPDCLAVAAASVRLLRCRLRYCVRDKGSSTCMNGSTNWSLTFDNALRVGLSREASVERPASCHPTTAPMRNTCGSLTLAGRSHTHT